MVNAKKAAWTYPVKLLCCQVDWIHSQWWQTSHFSQNQHNGSQSVSVKSLDDIHINNTQAIHSNQGPTWEVYLSSELRNQRQKSGSQQQGSEGSAEPSSETPMRTSHNLSDSAHKEVGPPNGTDEVQHSAQLIYRKFHQPSPNPITKKYYWKI